ncbi:expressed conserved protein [Echinococcus multilocularis]|uniref:Expressed conserved protein n=1 Tax=Echinococcus multilocularis TaxID=6211 RepID=A0A087VY05_ECHMU|nr:expressed conserved protein [Echinococcus multilocularis]
MSAYLLALLFLTTTLAVASDSSKDLGEFRDCVKVCSDQYWKCLEQVGNLWKDFARNRRKIFPIINACCMKKARREDASPEDSFAACTRIRCGALLFGCQIVKNRKG